MAEKVRVLVRSGDWHEKNTNDMIIWQVAGNKNLGIILIGKLQVNMASVTIIWKVAGNIRFPFEGKSKSSGYLWRVAGKYRE